MELRITVTPEGPYGETPEQQLVEELHEAQGEIAVLLEALRARRHPVRGISLATLTGSSDVRAVTAAAIARAVAAGHTAGQAAEAVAADLAAWAKVGGDSLDQSPDLTEVDQLRAQASAEMAAVVAREARLPRLAADLALSWLDTPDEALLGCLDGLVPYDLRRSVFAAIAGGINAMRDTDG